MIKIICLTSLLLICMDSFSQQPQPVVGSFMDMDNLMQQNSPEKIYLTTDRSMYAAGDTVWISAWVLHAAALKPNGKSKMLHVELLRPNGTLQRHLVLEIDQGVAYGQLALPPGIANDALFRLRAYTRWSLNFDESYRFEKQIPVVQMKDKVWQGPKITENKNFEWVRTANGRWVWIRKTEKQEEDVLMKPINEDLPPLDVQFLPEGGRWVTGFPSRMAFKAVADDGRGVNVEGEIVDDLGETVAPFQSQHLGMGSVFLVPQRGRTYHARLFSGHTVDLPAPDTTGTVMTIQPVCSDTLMFQLYFSPDVVQRGEPFYLAIHSRGLDMGAWEVLPLRSRISMRIPVDNFLAGVARFSLLTQAGIPCNERLVFIDHKDEIKLKMATKLEQNIATMQLQANNVRGNPVRQGVFTVSVTDSLYGNDDIQSVSLRSQMLLSSDLKGKIENPGWYFQERDSLRMRALDLVMQTHGWSGFSWDDIRNANQLKLPYEPEDDYRISGRVTNLRGAPARDVSVTLFAQGATTLVDEMLTDAQGRFIFENLLPMENTLAKVIANHQRGQRNALGLGIALDKQTENPSPPVEAFPESDSREAWDELLTMYRRQRQSNEQWLDSLLGKTDANLIKEVVIEAKRPVKGSWNLNGPGQADHVLYEEDIARYDKYDRLLDILKAEFSQFHQESWKNDELLRMKYMPIRDKNMVLVIHKGTVPDTYPIWRFENRTVLFVLNGRVIPAEIPAEDNFTLSRHPKTDSLQLIASKFWNIAASEVTGIEIVDSPEYVWAYDGKIKNYYPMGEPPLFITWNGPLRPLIVEITTQSGSTNLERTQIGTAQQHLRGFAVPKSFYVHKYYPEDIFDRAEYDLKPTIYWNPEVVTDQEGRAEIRFPVGNKPHGLQIRVEGMDLQGGIGSIMQRIEN